MILELAAIGAAVAAIVMGLHWYWQQHARYRAIADAGWLLATAILAVVYAMRGDGWPPRRSAVAFLVASWAARRSIQILYTRVFGQPEEGVTLPPWQFGWRALAAFAFSLPALAACLNPAPEFSTLELVGAGLWIVGFMAEASERRPLRPVSWLIQLGYFLFAGGSVIALA